ncbi:MAG: alpha/beta hydrolase [Clostridia bacterium]|nr:alpha/beta hydrolase [Clostridia bacterium]
MFEKIILRDSIPEVSITPVLCDPRLGTRDAILVIPGGGYGCVCDDREGFPVAMAFASRGMSAFVLKYSVGAAAKGHQPLIDASVAMAYIKAHADDFCIDPARVSCVGFSAGGHLSGSLGCFWYCSDVIKRAEINYGENRPLVTVMGYPVVSGVDSPHSGSFRAILGEESPTKEQLMKYSLELCVNEKTRPAFLFHTAADAGVPVQNSLTYARALADNKIPFELHIYPYGPHGIALANELTGMGRAHFIVPEAAGWVDDAVRFIRSVPTEQ